jgi:dTDP-glucose 4,6-dehydratase
MSTYPTDTKSETKYVPRNIVVTGGAGFIGSHVVNYLMSYSASSISIVVVDRLDYCSRIANWFVETTRSPRFFFYRVDIADRKALLTILQNHDIDTVLHFAAQTHVDNSFTNSDEFIRDNVGGTNNLLHACDSWGKIRRFVHVSTDEVYGEVLLSDKTGCSEDAPLNPTNPYAATKAGAEFIAKSFMKSFKIPIIITRMSNVYGNGQYPDKLIPKFLVLVNTGHKLPIHGNGKARRNWLHTSDVCTAFVTILEKGKDGEVYNIGSANECSVIEMAEQIVNAVHGKEGKEVKLVDHIEYVTDRPFNDARYLINPSKLKSLGWKERKSYQDGFTETLKWYQAHIDEYRHLFKSVK